MLPRRLMKSYDDEEKDDLLKKKKQRYKNVYKKRYREKI